MYKRVLDLGCRLRRPPLEAVFWLVALGVAASLDPQAGGGINLCLLENVGLPCPGDGLGRSIAHLVRGELAASWAAHPLGGPAVVLLSGHGIRLCFDSDSHSGRGT